jgi:hypothetical protein
MLRRRTTGRTVQTQAQSTVWLARAVAFVAFTAVLR